MKVSILTVPYDSGYYRVRMGRGPEHLTEMGLRPLLSSLGCQVTAEDVLLADSYPAEIHCAFALSKKVSERVRVQRSQVYFPIVLSGNCNTAVGAVCGCGCRTTGVVWLDAHGEANTPETTTSGFLDGMGIAILTGQCWYKLAAAIPEFEPVSGTRILLVGSRDVEAEECVLLDRIGVRRLPTIEDLEFSLESLAHEVGGGYLHVDLDVLDPAVAVANQWATPGGLSIAAVTSAAEAIQAHTTIKGLGIASYDPDWDQDRRAIIAACSIAKSVLSTLPA